MKNLVVLNKTDTPKYALLTGVQAFTDQGPEGTFFSDKTQKFGGTRQVISQEAFKAPTKLVKSGEMAPVDMEGQFVVEINGVVVPFIFKAEDLGDYFNEGDGNTTGLIFESADAGPWVAGQLANLSSPIKENTLAQAITTPDGWGLSLVVPVEGTDGYARQMSPKPLTLPKVGLRSTYGNFDGMFVAMVSETSEPGAGASQMKILNLQNGNMVIVGEADGEVIRDVKFTEKFVLITTDKALFYSKIEPDGSTILNHSFMPNKGYASYNDIVANNKLLLTVVSAVGADGNSRDVSLRAVKLGVNGEVESPISAYGIGGYLANFNTGFGGGVVSNKIIEVTEDAFLLPLDNELILCKVDHGNKTIITSKLATTGTTAVKMRDVTFGVIDVLTLSTPDKYTVSRIDVGPGTSTVVKPMSDLGFMAFTDVDSLIHMENSKIAFNGYAPGVDGGVLHIANFDSNNVLTNFAEIAPLPPQV